MTLCIYLTHPGWVWNWHVVILTCCHLLFHTRITLLSQLLPLAQWSTTHKPSIVFSKADTQMLHCHFMNLTYISRCYDYVVLDVNRSIIFRVWLAKWQSSNWHLTGRTVVLSMNFSVQLVYNTENRQKARLRTHPNSCFCCWCCSRPGKVDGWTNWMTVGQVEILALRV